jgi:hypothetical protein
MWPMPLHAEGLVAPFNSGVDDLADEIAIASGRRLGVGDDDIDYHLPQRGAGLARRGDGDRRWVERLALDDASRRL